MRQQYKEKSNRFVKGLSKRFLKTINKHALMQRHFRYDIVPSRQKFTYIFIHYDSYLIKQIGSSQK